MTEVAALLQQSLAAHQQGDIRRAAIGYLQVLAREPQNPDALHLLGMVMKGGGQPKEAAKLIRKAIRLQPDFCDALYNLGSTYLSMGNPAQAAETFSEALHQQPENPRFLHGLGLALEAEGLLAKAAQAFKEAVRLDPDALISWVALATVLRQAGALEAAIATFRKAVSLRPDEPELRVLLAEALLLAGQYDRGFEHYEARLRLPHNTIQPQPPELPRWDGRQLRGRVVVVAEPVIGDILMFSRCLVMLRSRVSRLTLVCPAEYANLFHTLEVVDEVIAPDDHWPVAKAYSPLASLPRLCGESRFGTVPYLAAPADAMERWAGRVAGEGVRIGLVWAGDRPRFPGDAPLTLRHFLVLPMPPGVTYYSLQTGPHAAEVAALGLTGTIPELCQHLSDFAELAVALAHMDLVITSDSAAAHLAGAMGRSAWVLLPAAPDWRWQQTGETSPWYPSLRLFRQTTPGDWAGLLETVGAEVMAAVVEGRLRR